jgi:Ca-activated chloride channel family protein
MSIKHHLGAVLLVAGALHVAPATASPVKLDAELSHGAISPAAGKVYLRINLTGIPVHAGERRTPVNVALVIDRSGSMADENKIGRAREAALMALARLGSEDIAAVIAYNHGVDILAPAAPVANYQSLRRTIEQLQATGRTALYAGTEQGLREVEKFRSDARVNRVILLSDGLANVGPSSPAELAELGRKAAQSGTSISTIGLGLGYNEDLMTKLAYASDGNHAFVERAEQLVEIFNKEFDDVLNVVAQDIIIHIEIKGGFKPIRSLGLDARVEGSRVDVRLGQLYGKQSKYIVLELEPPAGASIGDTAVAEVSVDYLGMGEQKRGALNTEVRGRITDRPEDVEAGLNKDVMVAVTTQLATEASEEAVKLRDAGKLEEAKSVLARNVEMLSGAAQSYGAALNGVLAQSQQEAEAMASDSDWNRTRKAMRANQHKTKTMQAY